METADEDGHYDGTMDNPCYELRARQAEMYRQGGFGIEVDFGRAAHLYAEAGEMAMVAMKGKLANRYYCLAEELDSVAHE